jgi:hypothetical protein
VHCECAASEERHLEIIPYRTAERGGSCVPVVSLFAFKIILPYCKNVLKVHTCLSTYGKCGNMSRALTFLIVSIKV